MDAWAQQDRTHSAVRYRYAPYGTETPPAKERHVSNMIQIHTTLCRQKPHLSEKLRMDILEAQVCLPNVMLPNWTLFSRPVILNCMSCKSQVPYKALTVSVSCHKKLSQSHLIKNCVWPGLPCDKSLQLPGQTRPTILLKALDYHERYQEDHITQLGKSQLLLIPMG